MKITDIFFELTAHTNSRGRLLHAGIRGRRLSDRYRERHPIAKTIPEATVSARCGFTDGIPASSNFSEINERKIMADPYEIMIQ